MLRLKRCAVFSIFKTSPCNRLRVAGAGLERGLPPYTLLEFLNFDIDTLRHYYNYEVFKQVVSTYAFLSTY